MLTSVLVRWPLVGVIVNLLDNTGGTWRRDKPTLHAYDLATLTLFAVFAARYIVEQWLYDQAGTGWLAFAKIAMGYPLYGVALIVGVWAVRKANQRHQTLTSASVPAR